MNLDHGPLVSLAWTQLWQVTLAAALLGTAAALLGRKRPQLAYTLLMLVLFKALVPPILGSPTGVFSWILATTAATAREGRRPIPRVVPVEAGSGDLARAAQPSFAQPAAAARPDPSHLEAHVAGLLAVAWLLGVAVTGCYAALKIARARALLRSCSDAPSDLVEAASQLARTLGMSRPSRVVLTDRPFGPAAFGVVRPTILLPDSLAKSLRPDQLRLILAHELIHIRRRDVLAGRIQLAAQLLWWFHPLVWWANRQASRVREWCCDREVIARLGCSPADYARGLLDVLERKRPRPLRPLFSLPGMRPVEITALRLELIMRNPIHHRHGSSLLCRFAFVAGMIVLIPGAAIEYQAPRTPSQTAPNAGEKVQRNEAGLDKAKLDLERAREGLEWARKMHEKGYLSEAQVAAERAKLETAKLRQAEERLKRIKERQREGQASAEEARSAGLVVAEGVVALAESELVRARVRADWAARMFDKGFVAKGQKVAEELNLGKAVAALEEARTALAALKGFGPLTGVVRDRESGKPISRVQISELSSSEAATVDEAGRFVLNHLPVRGKYTLVALPLAGQPYLISSKVVERADGEEPGPVELELTLGVPFRVKVLDAATNRPISGALSYFPVTPNDPFERGVNGYTAGGPSLGAYYEALPDGRSGEYYGAVLAGPGVLCFTRDDGKGQPKRGGSKPEMFYPDGENAVKLVVNPADKTALSAPVPAGADSKIRFTSLDLRQYDAVIAINPRPGASEVMYEIRLDPAGRRE